MQWVFVLISLLLLVVAVFALQNADSVTVRFLHWQIQASVAVVTLGSTTVGALVAGLFGLAARLRRWQRRRTVAPPAREVTGPEPGPPMGPTPRPGP
jgi:uncharacterized integral membrane protein